MATFIIPGLSLRLARMQTDAQRLTRFNFRFCSPKISKKKNHAHFAGQRLTHYGCKLTTLVNALRTCILKMCLRLCRRASSYEPDQPGLARFRDLDLGPATLSCIKISTYQKPGWPGYRDLGNHDENSPIWTKPFRQKSFPFATHFEYANQLNQ